jgi:hypothetical protein
MALLARPEASDTAGAMLRRFGFSKLYLGWIALCAVLFLALAGAEDPSRPKGQILSIEAGRRALAVARERDRARFASYEVVHVARARAGEGGQADRWIVLLDRNPPTRLDEAIVVELAVDDGRLLTIRRPAGAAR